MAELLVRAKKHWMDDFTQEQINALTGDDLASYNARVQIGDIIIVKADGWQWGNEECLPTFIIVKLPGVSVDAVKHYENVLWSGDIILKRRQYRVPESAVLTYVGQGNSVITIAANNITQFRNSIVEKTS